MRSMVIFAGLLIVCAVQAQESSRSSALTYDDIKSRLESPASDDEPSDSDSTTPDDIGTARPDDSGANSESSPDAALTDTSAVPGLLYIDTKATTRALERSLLRLDALLLAPGHSEISLSLSSSRDRQSSPVLLQDETGASLAAGDSEWQTERSSVRLELQTGLPLHSELELSIPFNSVRASTTTSFQNEILDEPEDTSSGIGDARLTLLKSIVEESGYRPDIIVFASVDGDTAEDKRPAIGTGATETTLGLNATKRQDPLVFTIGLAHTLATRADELRTGARTRLTLGTVLATSPRTSLRFHVSQNYTDGATLDGRDLVSGRDRSASLSIGATTLATRRLLVSGAVSAALSTDDTDYSFNLVVSRRFELFRQRPTSY